MIGELEDLHTLTVTTTITAASFATPFPEIVRASCMFPQLAGSSLDEEFSCAMPRDWVRKARAT